LKSACPGFPHIKTATGGRSTASMYLISHPLCVLFAQPLPRKNMVVNDSGTWEDFRSSVYLTCGDSPNFPLHFAAYALRTVLCSPKGVFSRRMPQNEAKEKAPSTWPSASLAQRLSAAVPQTRPRQSRDSDSA
jgi:hypothetical protein